LFQSKGEIKLEYSLGLLKPGYLKRNLENWVMDKVLNFGLKVVMTKRLTFTPGLVDVFYPQCVGRDYYDGLCEHLCSGPSFVYIVRASDAINRLNVLTGFNDPALAAEGTIRSAGENIRCNLAHSSENFDQFFREAVVTFSKEEVIELIAVRK